MLNLSRSERCSRSGSSTEGKVFQKHMSDGGLLYACITLYFSCSYGIELAGYNIKRLICEADVTH